MAAQKKQAFTQAFEPVPMTPCVVCKKEGEREDEFFALVGGLWFCRPCWRLGGGRNWPKPKGEKMTPVSTSSLRRPSSWKPATTHRGGK